MGSVTNVVAAVRPTVARPAVQPQDIETASQAETVYAPEVQDLVPAPARQGRGLFGHFADLFIGGGEAIWDMAKGIGTLIAHPIQTIKGLGYAITHPAALFHAFVDPYAQAIAEGRPMKAVGRGIVEIGSFFITAGGGGAATGTAKGAAAGANAGTKAARAAGAASKAAGKAGQAAKAASKVASGAARIASKPVFTKAAAAAAKQAGISTKIAQSALKAAHVAYWEARAAGKAATVAKAAAAAKAAKIMGVAKNAAVVTKVVNGARLSGAAANAANWFTKTNYVTRPLVTGAKIIGRPIDRAIVGATKVSTVMSSRVGGTIARLGAITLKDLALAPFKIPMAAARGVKGILTGAVMAPGKVAAGLKGLSAAELVNKALRLPGTLLHAARTNPASLVRPAAAIGMANRIGQGALGVSAGLDPNNPAASLTDEQIKAIAEQYGLEPSKQNVASFIAEVQSYAGGTIGPDTGSPEEVKQLQTVLRAFGYDVDPTGTFDDKTAAAVIDFKTKHGITQSYRLADGNPAVNEYVDEATAQALVTALKAGEKATDAPKTDEPAADKPADKPADRPADEPAADKPADEPPSEVTPEPELPAAQPIYTVTSIDRASGLSGIARRYLGDSRRWKEIYDLNKDAIGNNPNLIVPGQKLKLPADAKGVPGSETTPPKPATKTENKPEVKPQPTAPAEPAEDTGTGLSEPQIAQLAKDYGLKATRANVEAFSEEVNSYRHSAIGPDVGDPETIKRLQIVLARLGYKVSTTGTFDEATTNAVIEFKVKHGLHQKYKLANGDWAINEYVDEDAAQAMANAVTK